MNRFTFLLLTFWSLSSFSWGQKPFVYPSVDVTNEEKINSPVLEFSPAFFEDGILFVSTMSPGKKYQGYDKRIKKPTMSIFLAKRNDLTEDLERPVPFALELTTKMHEGPLTFDRNAEKVYFTRNDLKKKRHKKSAKLKIYESIKSKDGKWSLPVELPFNLDDFDTAHPTISADGETLVFSSNRPDGQGGMDLYIVHKEGDTWTEPENLGPQINTPKNEIFPFLHADNSLFFSSDGHQGLGQLDIFYTVLDENDRYAAPVNLGEPFNSPNDDLGFILDRDKKNGYFSSTRKGGKGEDDIYRFNVNDGNIDEYFYFQHRVPDVLEDVVFSASDPAGDPIEGMNIAFLPLNDPAIDASMLGRDEGGKIVLLPQTGTKNNYEALQEIIQAKGRKASTKANGQLHISLPKGYYATVTEKDNYSGDVAIISTSDAGFSFHPKTTIGCTPVRGKVVNERNQAGIPNVLVKMLDANNQLITSSKADDLGQFDACAKCGKIYHFDVEMNGAKIGTSELDTKNTPCDIANSLNIIIPVGDASIALQEGSIIELKNLYFNFNDASIRANARQDLDDLAEVLKKYPDMEIEIASYTDAVGSKDYNLGISQKRAEKVAEYLVAKGIDSDRLLPIGYGESGIRNRCKNGVKCSDKEHQYNRRIEIKVTKSSIPVRVTYVDDPDTTNTASTASTPTTPSTSHNKKPYGKYHTFHVVIGAFLMEQNAEKRAQQAINLGLDETGITSFDDTPAYHSVVVKTFSDYDEALQFAQMLKSSYGFKYYIKKM